MSKFKNPATVSERVSEKDVIREQVESLDTDVYQGQRSILAGNPNIFQAVTPQEQPIVEVRTEAASQLIDLAAVQVDRENSAQMSELDRIRHDIGTIHDEVA